MEPRSFLINAAQGMLTRLEQVKPFSVNIPHVPAAAVSSQADRGIKQLLQEGKSEFYQKVRQFIDLLRSPGNIPSGEAQKAFAILKLRFNALLDQLDIFSDVISQRCEHDTGIFLSGLDVVAQDALRLPGEFFHPPPIVCYLDRGHGAAIRRARTRLPGGKPNPVAVIRVPRERMISSGIASSLIHEVGHQGAALLGLIPAMRGVLREMQIAYPREADSWKWLERWISEIIADGWSVFNLGIGATMGLVGVVSLPKYFVFRINRDGPHPFPWIRVKISCAMGKYLYPDPQWDRLSRLWENLYPLDSLPEEKKRTIRELEKILPRFARLLFGLCPPSLNGNSFESLLPISQRSPQQLKYLWGEWKREPHKMCQARPSLVFAVVSQAQADRRISPEKENRLLVEMLRKWAEKNKI